MEREFCSYEQALALKELGFDEECMAGYDKEDNTLYIAYLINAGVQFNSHYYDKAPLKQQVFRWFREKYELIGLIEIGTQASFICFSSICLACSIISTGNKQ